MSNFLSQSAIPVIIRPTRSIGGISATITIEEVGTDILSVTSHPVQQGASISDHAFVQPSEITIRAGFDSNTRPLTEIYEDLLRLQASREPFDVITGKRVYKNMLFNSLTQQTDLLTENVLMIIATLKQVNLVSVEVTIIAPRAQQADPGRTGQTEKTGAKSAQPLPENESGSKRRSILQELFG